MNELQSQKKQIFYNKKTKVVVIYDNVDKHNYKLVITPYYSDKSKELMSEFKLYMVLKNHENREILTDSETDSHIIENVCGECCYDIFMLLFPMDCRDVINQIGDDYHKYLSNYYINSIIGKERVKNQEDKTLKIIQTLLNKLNNYLKQATKNKISNQVALQDIFALITKNTKPSKNKSDMRCNFEDLVFYNLNDIRKEANIHLIGDSAYQKARDNMYQTKSLNALNLQLSDFLLNTFITIDEDHHEIRPVTLKNVKALVKGIDKRIKNESKEDIKADVASYLAKHSKYIK